VKKPAPPVAAPVKTPPVTEEKKPVDPEPDPVTSDVAETPIVDTEETVIVDSPFDRMITLLLASCGALIAFLSFRSRVLSDRIRAATAELLVVDDKVKVGKQENVIGQIVKIIPRCRKNDQATAALVFAVLAFIGMWLAGQISSIGEWMATQNIVVALIPLVLGSLGLVLLCFAAFWIVKGVHDATNTLFDEVKYATTFYARKPDVLVNPSPEEHRLLQLMTRIVTQMEGLLTTGKAGADTIVADLEDASEKRQDLPLSSLLR
jgi:hypothetical protein